jgi:HKD family nuclease
VKPMTNIIYVVQRPSEGPAILNAYRNLAMSVPFDRLTGLYAFASVKGARLLVDAFRKAAPNWNTVVKRWVISIDGGITEPNALRFLLRQRRTEVRVPDGEELLNRRLKPIHRFHPKSLLLERQGPTLEATGILVGSANLTCSGLCFGHEHALVTQLANGPIAASLAAGIDELSAVVASATRIDEDFVDRYEAIRPPSPRLFEDFEDKRSEKILQEQAVIPSDEAAVLASVNNLWVEIDYVVQNRGIGEEGNQIDLKRGDTSR